MAPFHQKRSGKIDPHPPAALPRVNITVLKPPIRGWDSDDYAKFSNPDKKKNKKKIDTIHRVSREMAE